VSDKNEHELNVEQVELLAGLDSDMDTDSDTDNDTDENMEDDDMSVVFEYLEDIVSDVSLNRQLVQTVLKQLTSLVQVLKAGGHFGSDNAGTEDLKRVVELQRQVITFILTDPGLNGETRTAIANRLSEFQGWTELEQTQRRIAARERLFNEVMGTANNRQVLSATNDYGEDSDINDNDDFDDE
jgi:hypothetical protein